MTTTMPTLHVGRGTYVGGVTVFPVWSAGPAVDDLDTGATPWVTVAERSSAPVVAELVVTNEGPRPVLMLEGELLEGGWQHRALAHDLVLAPGAARVVEVVCVEQGRWSPSAGHARGGRRASPSVRSSLHGPATGRQGAVWSRVARYGDVLTPSPTGSLVDHLDRQPDDVPLATPMPASAGSSSESAVSHWCSNCSARRKHWPPTLRSYYGRCCWPPPSYRSITLPRSPAGAPGG